MTDVFDRLKVALSARYHIEREVGAGGMATVYLAKDLRHERLVAVKVLRPELAAALGPDRFLREIKIAAGLHHPHILPLFDSGEADGFLYYVMPYEEGQSLRERLERHGELPISEAVRILRDVVDALGYAHKQDLVHRDIKPDNILLSDRHALVTDFGVAKAVSEATGEVQLTKEGDSLGTPTYMAPEQASGSSLVDHRADIYAVGAVAYELLTGRPPFLGTTAQMVLSAHIVDNPEPVTKYREAVPLALDRLVLKCLEKSAADRWQSAEELLSALEAFTTPSGGVTSVGMRPPGSPGRRRASTVFAAVAMVVAVVILAIKMIPPQGETELIPDRILVLPFENRTGDGSLEQLGAMAADWLTEGLMDLTGVVQPVPTMQVLQVLQAMGEGNPGETVATERLAEATGAGTLISGSFYRHGDSLEFQAQVADAIEGTVLGATGPVRSSVGEPGDAIGLLRQQVTSIVAARFDPFMQIEIPASVRPPTFKAFRAYSTGFRAFVDGNWTEALRNLELASELDTTYVRASLMAIPVHVNLGELAVAESLLVRVSQSSESLTPYDRLRVEFILSGLHGDRGRAYRAARAAAELVPGGTTHYSAIGAAVRVNHPSEALEISSTLRLPGGGVRPVYWYFGSLTSAHHLLGDHEHELVVARNGRDSWPSFLPTIAYEVRALAALGEIDRLQGLVDECLTLRPQRGWTAGDVIRTAFRELVVHGHPGVGREVLRRAYQGHGDGSLADAGSESERFDLAQTLYLDERFDEAALAFGSLWSEFPQDVDYLGFLGVVAARQGDRERANSISEQLRAFEQPYIRGEHTLWRARIASLLGDKDAAVTLLRRSLGEGRGYGPELHADLDFQPLWDFPPFQELLRPKQ